MAPLPSSFYDGDTVEITRRLLGKVIVRQYRGELLACRITETEAYVGRCDKACHAYGYRKTARTATLFAPPGRAYIPLREQGSRYRVYRAFQRLIRRRQAFRQFQRFGARPFRKTANQRPNPKARRA